MTGKDAEGGSGTANHRRESIAIATELAVPASISLAVSQFLKSCLLVVFEEAFRGDRDKKRARKAVASRLKTGMLFPIA